MAITHKKDKIIIHSYLWQGINRKGKKVTGEYKSKNEKDVNLFRVWYDKNNPEGVQFKQLVDSMNP